MLHVIFQRHGLTPDEIYNKPFGARKFIYNSMMLALEEEVEEAKKREREGRKKSRRRG